MTTSPQTTDIDAVDMIRALALSCPGVAAMSPSTRTYLPGRTVAGVTTDQARVDVHVIAQYGTPLPGITQRLGTLIVAVLAGRALHVHVDDIVLPGDTPPAETPPPAPAASPRVAGVGG